MSQRRATDESAKAGQRAAGGIGCDAELVLDEAKDGMKRSNAAVVRARPAVCRTCMRKTW
jgi:hypothetical protein